MRFKMLCLTILSVGGLVSVFNGCGEQQFASIDPEPLAKASITDDGMVLVDEIDTPEEVVIAENIYACHEKDCDDDKDADTAKDTSAAKGKMKENKKVLVCHIPPGNAAARKTICISSNALRAHVDRHSTGEEHDYMGRCKGEVAKINVE